MTIDKSEWPRDIAVTAVHTAGQDGWVARATHATTRIVAMATAPDPLRACRDAVNDVQELVEKRMGRK